MFTGLVEEIGVVRHRSGADLGIMAQHVLDDLAPGDSIAVDGACLTVVALQQDGFVVQVSRETLARTTLDQLRPGHAVNLERAMRADARFGGHFVLGHVDGTGIVEQVRREGEFSMWGFRAPDEVARYLAPKGSVAVDGISLTVVEPSADRFSVAIIPATIEKTKLGTKRPGDAVNMEADLIGKHIYHYMKGGSSEGVTRNFLAEHGFAQE